jgi:hypothetical protein
MLVDARNAGSQTDYKVGQEVEGAEAEYQVALGQAEAIESTPAEAKAEAKQDAADAKKEADDSAELKAGQIQAEKVQGTK